MPTPDPAAASAAVPQSTRAKVPPHRPISPPLPPRKNAAGLPPTYLAHLRRLTHQLLSQQTRPADQGLPSSSRHTPRELPLWSEDRVEQLFQAIWKGAISPPQQHNGRHPEGHEVRRGLLQADWGAWASGAARRRKLWREQERERQKEEDEGLVIVQKPREGRGQRGRSKVATAAMDKAGELSTASTSRASSMTSLSRLRKRQPASEKGKEKQVEGIGRDDESSEEDKERAWQHMIEGMRGFDRLRLAKRDEWDVIEDDLPQPSSSQRDLPGAFPQSSSAHASHLAAPQAATASSASASPPILDTDVLKLLFCVHVHAPPAPPPLRSGSTLRLSRHQSRGSVGSLSDLVRRRSGTAGKWFGGSDMTVRNSMLADGHVELAWVEGRFAIPQHDNAPRRGREASVERKEEGEDSDAESSVLGTIRSRSGTRTRREKGWSAILGGGATDVPQQALDDGTARVVGGTIVVHGVRSDAERDALQRVLSTVIFTIQAMHIELALLDAFRIPREPDPPPPPPKPLFAPQHQHSPFSMSTSGGALLRRKSSQKTGEGKGDRKGFFHRLGKDTKGAFEGLFGRPRRQETDHTEANTFERAIIPEDNAHSEAETSWPATPATADSAPLVPEGKHALQIKANVLSGGSTAERYLLQLENMEKMIWSTTPGLTIPMPTLLERVRREHKIRAERANMRIPSAPEQHREADGLPAISARAAVPLASYRLAGDVRSGLGALKADLTSWEGWVRVSQKLEVLSCLGCGEGKDAIVCERPKGLGWSFWGEGDCDLGEWLTADDTADGGGGRWDTCEREGCEAGEDHTRWFFHGDGKVGVRRRKLEVGEDRGEETVVWVRCRICGSENRPRVLGETAEMFSFAKLLELIMYSSVLVLPTVCSHASSTKSMSYIFRTATHRVHFHREDLQVLDVRLPKLQVGGNIPRRSKGAGRSPDRRDQGGKEAEKAKAELLVEIEEWRKAGLEALESASPIGADVTDSGTPAGPDQSDGTISDTALRVTLQQTTHDLLEILGQTPHIQLNDVRRAFLAAITAFDERLAVRQSDDKAGEAVKPGGVHRPTWAKPESERLHMLAGGSVLVKDDEPITLIAYTLSSAAYLSELEGAQMSSSSQASSLGLSTAKLPNWTTETTRRDTPRDLLSLRTTLSKKSSAPHLPKTPAALAPLSLTSANQPSLELSLDRAEGKSQIKGIDSEERVEEIVRTIGKATGRNLHLSDTEGVTASPRRLRSGGQPAPPSAFRALQRSASQTSSPLSTPIMAARSVPESEHGKEEDTWGSSITTSFANSYSSLLRLGTTVSGSIRSPPVSAAPTSRSMSPHEPQTSRSLASMLGGPLSYLSPSPRPASPSPSYPDSLSTAEEKPHLHFTYTLPDTLRFSCTVYFASQFDVLRRRCGIRDASFVESLTRCEGWGVSGGKSKAGFWKSTDGRWVVKELVRKWNVSDTHAMLEIAPAYFEHMSATHGKATALVKIVGFYTVKTHDLKSGAKTALDLVVMENLFWKQSVDRTFDLKGIEGRKVLKPTTAPTGEGKEDEKDEATQTMFDGDWLEGMARAPVLLRPYAKRALHEALSLDTRFLSNQAIMDYSLLTGLDSQRGELVMGVVDAIGSYGLFKDIESRGKMALKRGGEVTVIPPDQYRERFETALKTYFLACPDKWSRSGSARSTSSSSATLPTPF